MNEIYKLLIVGIAMYGFAWFQAYHVWGKKLKVIKPKLIMEKKNF